MSNKFPVLNGIRQGCPASGLLFVLAVEVLANKIRASNSLRGFNFGFAKPVQIVQYADDGVIFLNDKSEFCCALNILKQFGKVSGLDLNVFKCEGLWLGRDKHKQENCTLYGIRWPRQFRCLGIFMGHDKELNEEKNFTEKIKLVEQVLNSWKTRNLTYFGKVQILKAHALSKLVLPASVLDVTPHLIRKIESMFFKFIWGKGVEKVKRKTLVNRIENGGLNMIDVEEFFQSLSASWISRIQNADPNSHRWSQLAHYHLGKLDVDNYGPLYNFDKSVLFTELDVLPRFYRNAVINYNAALSTTVAHFKQDIMNQPLWGNKHLAPYIHKKRKVLFLRNWIRAGVRKVKDLKFIDGKLDVNYMYHRIPCKENIYCELRLVRQALLPFQQQLTLNQNHNKTISIPHRAKGFYVLFRTLSEKRIYH